jgi:predicted ATP-grasp superfamily ATP-dependent carboligase
LRDPDKKTPLRVLLSEGGSTSARQAITILGLAGHHVEVCDPSPYCLGRFSRFVKAFHRCPGIGKDPAAYLAFVEKLLAERRFDVLLPIHDQGLLLARLLRRIEARTGIALPDFADYRIALGKAGFSRLLDELALPQPGTRIVGLAPQLREAARFPCLIKTAYGTASRGVWLVRDEAGLEDAIRELTEANGFAGEVLVQDFVVGKVGHAQAVFCRGQLIALHGYRRIAAGAGGGEAIKQSVLRPDVRLHLQMIGTRLAWHGALSVDYIQTAEDAAPLYIDCNPRLVEPMSAWLAGLDLVDVLLRVSLGETPQPVAEGRAGVRTHLAMQALLGCALRGGTRRDLFREGVRLLRGRPPYAESVEELTPPRLDWLSAVPLALTAAILLVAPQMAATLAAKGWGDHLLDARSVRIIADAGFG